MAAEPLYELLAEPLLCCGCGHEVRARVAGRNLPCRCVADTAVCWPHCCADAADAEALQEALEDQDRQVMSERLARIDRAVEEALQEAEAWRPGVTAWVLFAMAVALISGAVGTLR